MESDELRFLDLTIENVIDKKYLQSKALLDTGASVSCLPKSMVNQLGISPVGLIQVQTAVGIHVVKQYVVNFSIDGQKFENCQIIEVDSELPLIGWDIISKGVILSSIFNKLVGNVVHFLGSIPSLKKSMVLVLGQDTTQIARLHLIQNQLSIRGYKGIIVKDQPDIDVQSIEEKVNMLASLCRFVICENSFPSGHIDELKICALNRFVTAIIQENGKGATWMQADYHIDYSFINTFFYDNTNEISNTINNAIDWAEHKLADRKKFFDKLYTWR